MPQQRWLAELQRYHVMDASRQELLNALGLLYNYMPGCAKLLDEDAFLLSMGQKGFELMEVEDFEPLRGVCWLDVWRGNYRQRADRAFKEAKQGGIGEFEGYAPTTQGTPKWWRVTILKVSMSGKPLYFALSQDITSERAQLFWEGDHSLGNQQSSEGGFDDKIYSFQIDNEGIVNAITEDAERKLQLHQGDSFMDRLLASTYAELEQEQEEHTQIKRDLILVQLPGKPHMHAMLHMQAVLSIEGEHVGWHVELTDLKNRESLKHELEQLYNITPGMVFVLDKQGCVTNCNPSVLHAFDCTMHELLKKSFRDFLTEDSVKTLLGDEHVYPTAATVRAQFKQCTDQDDPRWYMLSIANDENSRYVYIYATDITEQKEAEDALNLANKSLIQHNQYLDMLRQISHHNLQEPVRKIALYSDFLVQNLNAVSDRIDESRLKKIRQSIHALSRIQKEMHVQLKALLKYVDTSQDSVAFKPCLMESIYKSIKESYQLELMEDPFELECHAPDDLTIACDQDLMTSMVMYVIDNSMKFKSTEVVVNAAPDDSGQVVLTIRDNGIGVEERHLERITMPFQQLDQKSEGSGMGLALAKKIAENHGATLSCHSAGPNTGLEVKITFPPQVLIE